MTERIVIPVCAKCGRMMRCKKNEFLVKDKPTPGLDLPVVVWSGDMFECPECGAQVVVGFGKGMIGETADAIAPKAMEIER